MIRRKSYSNINLLIINSLKNVNDQIITFEIKVKLLSFGFLCLKDKVKGR